MNATIPVPGGLADYRTTIPNASEWVDKILWDTQSYAQAGQVSLDFFQSVPANLPNGNLQQAGTIGNNVMIVRSIGVFVRSNIGTDIAIIATQGILRFDIGAKNYGIWPIDQLPAAGGVVGWGMNDTGLSPYTVSNHGVPDPRAAYTLTRPLLIPPNLNFKVRLEWAAAIAISVQTSVTVMLSGEMGRFVQ